MSTVSIDLLRAETLQSARPANADGTSKAEIQVDSSSRFNRSGLRLSRGLRALGIIAAIAGSYNVHTNVQEIYDAPDAIVDNVRAIDNSALDEAASRLLSGKIDNAEKDGKTIEQGFSEIMTVIDDGVDDLLDDGRSTAEGVQEVVMGGLLAVLGQAGASVFKRRRRRALSYLDVDPLSSERLFRTPLMRHVSRDGVDDTSETVTLKQQRGGDVFARGTRVYQKLYVLGMGSILVASLGASKPAAEAADNTLTNLIDRPVLTDFERSLVEDASRDFEERMTRDIQAAIEAELPKTMKLVDTNPFAKQIYDDQVATVSEANSNRADAVKQLEIGPTFFERMRDKLNDRYYDIKEHWFALGTVLVSAGSLLAARAIPGEFGIGKAKVSKRFLDKNLGKNK